MAMRWWRNGPRVPSVVLFAIVALSLFGSMFAIFTTLNVEAEEREQVVLTNTVISALRDSSRAIINAETGQRGYIITQDPDYLAPYYRGEREWPVAQAQLESSLMAVATPEQAELVRRLRNLATAKLIELEETVQQVENGEIDAAKRRVLTDEGRNTMVRYREAVQRLESIEQDILNKAQARANLYEGRLVPILIVLVVTMIAAMGLGIWQMVRIARAEALAASAELVAQQRDRADLVSRELNHRVQNLFAVIQAIVQMSLRSEDDIAQAREKVISRIQALSTAHRVTQGQLETPIAKLRDIVDTALAPYSDGSHEADIEGADVYVAASQVTPLGLILHELTTNCVKYGAWSDRQGDLHIKWSPQSRDPEVLDLYWTERIPGGVRGPLSHGFGTRMVEASARQLSGDIERRFDAKGMQVRLRFRPAAG